jgi:hypothetical protein
MVNDGRPKRALLAYCALAGRLNTAGMGITHAMTPFFAEICKKFAGELFDAQKFSNAVNERFGFNVPRLAALGLAEQLADEGLLEEVSGHATKMTVYRYSRKSGRADESPISAITEQEVESILTSFVGFCRSDDRVAELQDSALHEAFFERLLHLDSMRILSRREGSIGAKKTSDTMILKRAAGGTSTERSDPQELHLDFLVSQFLLDLRDTNASAFDQVSNIAFANMAAEAIACLREPQSTDSLEGLTVYLDSPLLLDALGVNVEYTDYGKELLEAVRAAGAKAAVFDHCVSEAENTVAAQLAYLRSGINKFGTALGTTARPDLLSALAGNIAERAEKRLGVTVHRDPEINLHRRAQAAVGDIQSDMDQHMHAWRNLDARNHDQQSVWIMLAIRNSTDPCPRVCDAKSLLLARNTSLVSIANKAWTTWLKGSTKHSASYVERWAPVAMSDKQFAGYLWARSGGGVAASIPRARLLAHCSAAVRPRADIKAKAYNLVLELSGKEEADDIGALFEDREGGRALMRATLGDPEDMTPERIPYIIQQVKLAAGEYAAAVVREEAAKDRAALISTHEQQLAAATRSAAAKSAQEAQVQVDLDRERYEGEKVALRESILSHERSERARKLGIWRIAFDGGCRVYALLRWGFVACLGAAAVAITFLTDNSPALAQAALWLLTVAGVWFVPELLHKPFSSVATMVMRREAAARDPAIEIPTERPDFREKTWSILDAIDALAAPVPNSTEASA